MTIREFGFDDAEFEARTAKMQAVMREKKLDAVFLTTEPNIRYYTGYYTQFWESPTRPWFLIIPTEGKPIAVIPGIGASGMAATWIDDIRTWSSPAPEDDGISLVAGVLNALPTKYGRVGATLGLQSYLRMPTTDYLNLSTRLQGKEFVDIALEMHRLRSVKSPAEIAKIRKACVITNNAFDRIPLHARVGQTERDICRQMRIDMLEDGAEFVKYLISGSGPDGYDSIIMGPTSRNIERGDVLIIDVGCVYDGYFSDFDRNFAFGECSVETKKAYECVYEATSAGFAAAHPGATTTDIYNAMWAVMEAGGALGNEVGRLGHGLGSQLTEWPSNTATDNTPLVPGMVITLEPGMTYAKGKDMVHEEDIVITEDGAEWLTRRASEQITIIT
ncbi:M24 family metallopeptidase [Desulfotalea psychrophila]|nr:Xaa-Pro peptidase family protein [Desulfotalea psychrophila]